MNTEQEEALCKALLKEELIRDDQADEGVGAYQTKSGQWYFLETNDFVMTRPTIREPQGHKTDRHKWQVQVCVTSGGSYWEPPDTDIVDVGEPQDSLWDAIKTAALAEAKQNIDNIAQGIGEDFLMREDQQLPNNIE